MNNTGRLNPEAEGSGGIGKALIPAVNCHMEATAVCLHGEFTHAHSAILWITNSSVGL